MNDEIINRVANSDLITIDLGYYYPKQNIVVFDVGAAFHAKAVNLHVPWRKAPAR